MFENVRDEFITYHRIANTFENKMGVTILRSHPTNMEICESQYGGTTPKARADPEKWGQGLLTPWKITRYTGFYME